MPKIVYYVAISLDGYIAGPGDDISMFTPQGSGVDQYQKDLLEFSTVIMGRRTYEFGYQFGLEPGQPAYPHMDHYIFSESLQFEGEADSKVKIELRSLDRVREIRANAATDVYLCGGGMFAGWLLEHGLVDRLKIKLNPIILGGGIRLFGGSNAQARWELIDTAAFDKGLQIMTYEKLAD